MVIAAAGNDGQDVTHDKFFPAGFGSDTQIPDGSGALLMRMGLPNVIAVGASDQRDNRASFSNYGTGVVHIIAPGVNIYNTYPYHLVHSESLYGSGWIQSGSISDISWTGVTSTGTRIYADIRPIRDGEAYGS
jgi:subtilisin family serine protease